MVSFVVAGVRSEAVVHGLGRSEPPVAVRILLDLLHGLAGVLSDELGHLLLDVQHLLGLDLDVRRGAADAAGGLVHHHPGVRGGIALTAGAGREQELAHRRRHAHGHGGDIVGHPLHGVEDRHSRGDRATG